MRIETTEPPAGAEDQVTGKEVTLGALLKAARLSQGLDLVAVANATRINFKNLIALEDDNRARLPADVFSRGFVRLYAAHLKLDPEEAIRLYEKQWGVNGSFVGSPLVPKKIHPLPARSGIFMSLLIIALFFGVRVYYPGGHVPASGNSHATIESPAKGGSEVVSVPSTPGAGQNLTATPPADATSGGKTAAEKIREAMDHAETTTTTTTTTPATGQAEPSPAAPVPPSPAYEISLRAANQITVKLSLDGQEAVEKMLTPGNSQTWQAAKGFALTLDRTDGVELTVNGAVVPTKTEAGQTVTIQRP